MTIPELQNAIVWGKTEFRMVHVPVRQALDESYDDVGPRPPYDERVYEAAIRAGATDEWRIVRRRIDGPAGHEHVHTVYTTQEEAQEAMRNLAAQAAAHAALLADLNAAD